MVKKIWSIWNNWITISVGILTCCALIGSGITWQFNTFATEEDILNIDQKMSLTISQLAQETIKSFEFINNTNIQIQKSIRKFEIENQIDRLIEQKYQILKLLNNDPDNEDLKIELEKCKNQINNLNNKLNNN
jgi:hypothetical protein